MTPSKTRNSIRLAAIAAALTAFLGIWPRAAEPSAKSEAERARAAIEESLRKDPANSELWTHLGYAWRELGSIDESQRAFEKAVSLNPKNLKAGFMLGLIYEKKKLKEKAIAAWTACLASPEPKVRDIAKSHLHRLENR
jgi:cytochrome c-type biogenesis protein CcmH/NrfG